MQIHSTQFKNTFALKYLRVYWYCRYDTWESVFLLQVKPTQYPFVTGGDISIVTQKCPVGFIFCMCSSDTGAVVTLSLSEVFAVYPFFKRMYVLITFCLHAQ